jgi:hypothetical protein
MTNTSTLKFINTGNSKDRSAIFAITKPQGVKQTDFISGFQITLHQRCTKSKSGRAIISAHIPSLLAICL